MGGFYARLIKHYTPYKARCNVICKIIALNRFFWQRPLNQTLITHKTTKIYLNKLKGDCRFSNTTTTHDNQFVRLVIVRSVDYFRHCHTNCCNTTYLDKVINRENKFRTGTQLLEKLHLQLALAHTTTAI